LTQASNATLRRAGSASPAISVGHNVFGSHGGISSPAGNGDQFNVTATQLALVALAANGGPVLTDALGSASFALNHGDNALLNSALINAVLAEFPGVFSFDERGLGHPRIVGGTVDVGAFE
jgi:hypothetical protein